LVYEVSGFICQRQLTLPGRPVQGYRLPVCSPAA
jgi:hypothetical protein